ncbi:hypothetical protein KJ848_03750 [Patescibacteria group bacterium]|nr:hypothetical protein [Patescibacteria group bacterium]
MPSRITGLIAYDPLSDEPNWKEISELSGLPLLYTIPASKDVDPFALAQQLLEAFSKERVGILVPGQTFDVIGTRHGRGSGWYDRFLSVLPDTWMRIGVCDVSAYSTDLLVRESWDVPMHMLYIKEPANVWRVQVVPT